MENNPTIPFAINVETNEKIFADDLIDKSIEDRRLSDYRCYYCNNTLFSSVNKNNKNIQSWFYHKNHVDCILTKEYTKKDIELDKEYLYNKESERHKLLKKYLRVCLYKQGAIKVEEEKIIFDKKSFFYRRPDVYCEYQNKKIAFEIQVSKLSYKSLKRRSEFFKKNDIYCIWIPNWFSPNLTQSDHDIKEINSFENIFTIDLHHSKFNFYVNYLEPSSKKDRWRKKLIDNLNNLIFDDKLYQVYFYNTPLYRSKIEQARIDKMDYQEEQKKSNNDRNRQKEIAKEYLNQIISMNITDECKFIANLEDKYKNFSNEIQEYFYSEIKEYSCNYIYSVEYYKPFFNNLIYHQYGMIVEFLLKTFNNLCVDKKDESNITIWMQLVGCPYGFADDGYIDIATLVPLINKHTKGKLYTVEEVKKIW